LIKSCCGGECWLQAAFLHEDDDHATMQSNIQPLLMRQLPMTLVMPHSSRRGPKQ
jgi:hypothetical protein